MPHSIKITGIAPPELSSLAEPLRRQFWSLVTPIALAVKDAELAAGLDAHGEPLKPISPATRKHRRSAMTPSGKGDPSAAPLMPAYQKSRVRSLLAGRAFATHCEIYWRYDPFTGASFDVILNYQRAMGRDVFGLSAEAMAKVKSQSWAAWAKWKKKGLAPTEKRSAFPSAALQAGPQSRIAGIIARSAEPGAGATAPKAVGSLSTRWITRGIDAPKVKDLKASATRSGAMTGPEWRQFFTAEEGGGKGVAVTPPAPPKPRPIAPKAPRPAPPVVAKVAMQPTPRPTPAPIPPPAVGPIGTPVSRALDVQAKGKTGQAIEAAIKSIDSVHGDGNLTRIPVKETRTGTRLGAFWRQTNGAPIRIDVSKHGDHPQTTVAHEIGHFLDYYGIPKTQPGFEGTMYRDFRKEAQFTEWVKAIEDSEAVKKLRGVMTKPYVVLERTAAGEKRYNIDKTHAKYLADDVELWARSYAQYVAHKSQSKEMLDEISAHRKTVYSGVYGDQWTEDDFRPIAAAFDNLFGKLGWLK